MINKKISIIVPAYNVAKWLPRCLNSLIRQSYKELEIIVINDGSTDETGNIIDEFAKKDERIIAIHQENKGLIAVREKGISIASGMYIGFVDGDDSVLPEMYERLIHNAIRYNASISQCGILYCLEDGRTVPMHGTNELIVYNKMEGLKALLKGDKIEPSLCNKIYLADLLKDSCLDTSILNNEDLLRNYVLFERAEKSVFEDFCGYLYWRREGSMSNNHSYVVNYDNILRARKKILDIANTEVKEAAYSCYLSSVLSCYNIMINVKDEEAKILGKKCRKELALQKKKLYTLNKGRILRILAILYVPNIYNILFKIHFKRNKNLKR